MDDGEVAQLPPGFLEPSPAAAAVEPAASFWDGYAEGSQKTRVQVLPPLDPLCTLRALCRSWPLD